MSDTPVLSLSREQRAQLVTHVESVGGWPAGFGIWGTRIAHEVTDGDLQLVAEDMATLWGDLLKLVKGAGISLATAESAPATDPATATPDAPPVVKMGKRSIVPGTGE